MIVSHHLQQRHGRLDLRQGRIAQAATAARRTIGLSLKAAQRFCDTLPLIYHYEVAVRSSICGAKILKLPCLLRVTNGLLPKSAPCLGPNSGHIADMEGSDNHAYKLTQINARRVVSAPLRLRRS